MLTSKATRWELVLEGFVPPSVNRLLSLHWARRSGLKREVADAVALGHLLGPASIPDAKGKRRVSVEVTMAGRGRLLDPDNILKCLLDALVANRLLVDDSSRWYEIGYVAVARGPATRTVITLEDVS